MLLVGVGGSVKLLEILSCMTWGFLIRVRLWGR